MAHALQPYQINAVVHFEPGQSVVLTKFYNQNKYEPHGKETTEQERKNFVDAFERIFAAAARGDLKTCQAIVERENFPDVDAFSVGKFILDNGDSLDYFSPRKIAQMRGHTHITQYFSKHFGRNKEENDGLNTPENIRAYAFHLVLYKEMASLFFITAIQERILSTYSFLEQVDLVPEVYTNNPTKLLDILKTRCGEKFTNPTSHDTEKRIELFAMQDALAERIKRVEAVSKAEDYAAISDLMKAQIKDHQKKLRE